MLTAKTIISKTDVDGWVCPQCGSENCGALAIVNMQGKVLAQRKQYICLNHGRDLVLTGLIERWKWDEKIKGSVKPKIDFNA